jgi:hypothetical protein
MEYEVNEIAKKEYMNLLQSMQLFSFCFYSIKNHLWFYFYTGLIAEEEGETSAISKERSLSSLRETF